MIYDNDSFPYFRVKKSPKKEDCISMVLLYSKENNGDINVRKTKYTPPDFRNYEECPNCAFKKAPKDKTLPDGFYLQQIILHI